MVREYKATSEDVARLIFHYQGLYDNTRLLVQYCAQRGVALDDGFRSVCAALVELREELRQMELAAQR